MVTSCHPGLNSRTLSGYTAASLRQNGTGESLIAALTIINTIQCRESRHLAWVSLKPTPYLHAGPGYGVPGLIEDQLLAGSKDIAVFDRLVLFTGRLEAGAPTLLMFICVRQQYGIYGANV